MTNQLTFEHFADMSRLRAARWHADKPWSQNDWMVAVMGELGEAANFLKKLNRSRDGIAGNNQNDAKLMAALHEEIADTLAYLFLFADSVGCDLEEATIDKFNKVSQRHGFPERIIQ